eukprot:COSAG02_NODE_66000_length_256_cov_1.210191_1_plen_62_part_01
MRSDEGESLRRAPIARTDDGSTATSNFCAALIVLAYIVHRSPVARVATVLHQTAILVVFPRG